MNTSTPPPESGVANPNPDSSRQYVTVPVSYMALPLRLLHVSANELAQTLFRDRSPYRGFKVGNADLVLDRDRFVMPKVDLRLVAVLERDRNYKITAFSVRRGAQNQIDAVNVSAAPDNLGNDLINDSGGNHR